MGNNELTHHGIKGQKWGKRRFQNPDGTLTIAGKKRYNDGPGDSSDRRMTEKEAEKAVRKKVSEMSNDELRAEIKRLEMEQKYASLQQKTDMKSKGKQFVADIILNASKQALTEYGKTQMVKGLNKATTEIAKGVTNSKNSKKATKMVTKAVSKGTNKLVKAAEKSQGDDMVKAYAKTMKMMEQRRKKK